MLETVWGKRDPLAPLMGMYTDTATIANNMEVLKKLKIELPNDPTIPLQAYIWIKTCCETCIPVFITALFTIAKTWKQPECPPADEWTKMWYIYAMKQNSVIKKNETKAFAAGWIDLRLSKTNIMWCHFYVESERKMIQLHLLTKQK